jgi:hypothetical protein
VINEDLNNQSNRNKIEIYIKSLEFLEMDEDLRSKISDIEKLDDIACYGGFLKDFMIGVHKNMIALLEK